jgi:glycosyltransferase involved in cell wall biosynthesis
MRLGVVVDLKKTFINELLVDWNLHYDTEIFSYQDIRLPVLYGRVKQWWLSSSLRRFIRSNDLIFFEWAGPFLVVASQLSINTPIIVRLHSFELFEYASKINWQPINRIVLVSEAMQKKFIARYPEYAERTRVVYHGKQLDKFNPAFQRFRGNLGMLGNLTPIKRVYELILTLSELNKWGYNLHLHLAGEPRKGPRDQRYYASLHRLVEKLGLQDQITFYGFVSDPENWLRSIDIFISNSFWEGQQNALIEALATGCYCLSHFWDGAEEILPPDYLYSTESDLQQKIIEYIEMSEEMRQNHRRRMRCLAEEKFRIENTASKMRMIIDELFQQTGG